MHKDIETALLTGLRRNDGEPFVLPASARAHLAQAFRATLEGPEAAQTVDLILRYVVAFRTVLGAPTIADVLTTLLREEPLAASHLQRCAAPGVDTARAFAKQLGETRPPLAPSFGAAAPTGSVRASELRNPGDIRDKLNDARKRMDELKTRLRS